MPREYALLALAILTELGGTVALKLSDGMTRLWPALFVVLCYGIAFWALAQVLRTLPVGMVYAIWSSLGIVGLKAVGVIWFGENFSWPAAVGTSLILAGVLTLTLLDAPKGP